MEPVQLSGGAQCSCRGSRPVEPSGVFGGAIQRRPSGVGGSRGSHPAETRGVDGARCGVGGEPSSGVGGGAVQREAQWTSGAQQWIIGGVVSPAEWSCRFLGSRPVEFGGAVQWSPVVFSREPSSGVVSPAEGSRNGVVGGAVQRSQWSCRGEPSSGAQWTTEAQCSPVSCPGKPFSRGVVGGAVQRRPSGVVGPAEAQWSCRTRF